MSEFLDPFHEMLPLLLSPEGPSQHEPSFDELHGAKTQRRYAERIAKRRQLEAQGRIATGSTVAVFFSEIGSKPMTIERKGQQVDIEYYFHSPRERAEHESAAQNLRRAIRAITVDQVDVAVEPASRQAIDKALLDAEIGHVIFVGHANRSQLVIQPSYTYNWHDLPQADHLKRSFGVFGCGAEKSGRYYPRVGSVAVDGQHGVLYGIGRDHLEEGVPYAFDQLVALPLDPIAGTPFEIRDAA